MSIVLVPLPNPHTSSTLMLRLSLREQARLRLGSLGPPTLQAYPQSFIAAACRHVYPLRRFLLPRASLSSTTTSPLPHAAAATAAASRTPTSPTSTPAPAPAPSSMKSHSQRHRGDKEVKISVSERRRTFQAAVAAGDSKTAMRAFDKFQRQAQMEDWLSLITHLYSQHKYLETATYFKQLQKRFIMPEEDFYPIMIKVYASLLGRGGSYRASLYDLFNTILRQNIPLDLASYTAIFTALKHKGDARSRLLTLLLYKHLRQDGGGPVNAVIAHWY